MEFRIQIVDNTITFRMVCSSPDMIERGFFEALSDKKIDKEDRHFLILSISDALIRIIEQEQDYAAASYTLEKFIDLYNASSTNN